MSEKSKYTNALRYGGAAVGAGALAFIAIHQKPWESNDKVGKDVPQCVDGYTSIQRIKYPDLVTANYYSSYRNLERQISRDRHGVRNGISLADELNAYYDISEKPGGGGIFNFDLGGTETVPDIRPKHLEESGLSSGVNEIGEIACKMVFVRRDPKDSDKTVKRAVIVLSPQGIKAGIILNSIGSSVRQDGITEKKIAITPDSNVPKCAEGYFSSRRVKWMDVALGGVYKAYQTLKMRITDYPQGSPRGVTRSDEINVLSQYSSVDSAGSDPFGGTSNSKNLVNADHLYKNNVSSHLDQPKEVACTVEVPIKKPGSDETKTVDIPVLSQQALNFIEDARSLGIKVDDSGLSTIKYPSNLAG